MNQKANSLDSDHTDVPDQTDVQSDLNLDCSPTRLKLWNKWLTSQITYQHSQKSDQRFIKMTYLPTIIVCKEHEHPL
jgi:hypothetical protein